MQNISREMETKDGDGSNLPFAYLGPSHPTVYFPDTARPALLFHRSLLRPHAVVLAKTAKDAGASLDLDVEESSAIIVDACSEGKSLVGEMGQTRTNEILKEKPAVCFETGGVEEKKNFVESSCQTEWKLPPKENFVPVSLARKREFRGTILQLEAPLNEENHQSNLIVQRIARDDGKRLESESVQPPSEVKAPEEGDNASKFSSPMLKTRLENSGARMEGEVSMEVFCAEKLISPSPSVEGGRNVASDNKEQSILPDNADVVMGILQEDIEQSNHTEGVLQQPPNNDVLADLIAELNDGLCDENKNAKALNNKRKFESSAPGTDSGISQQVMVEKAAIQEESTANLTFCRKEEGCESSTSNPPQNPVPKALIPRPNGITIPFPFPSKGVAISPVSCLPLTAFRPLLLRGKAKPQVNFLPTVDNNSSNQHQLQLPQMIPKLPLGTTTEALQPAQHTTLPPMRSKPFFPSGGFNSCPLENSKTRHVGFLVGEQEGHADANLNTITISSDEEDSQVPGGLQEVRL